jgi:UDP-3-O-[3-hydroxymyristoyl] glucosamine N-acyltransferase
MKKQYKLHEIATFIGAQLSLSQDKEIFITDIHPLEQAHPQSITFLHHPKYVSKLQSTCAKACIIHPDMAQHAPESLYLLMHEHPYKAYAKLTQLFYPGAQHAPNIAPTAYIAPTATIDASCHIAHGAYIGEHAVIHAHTYIGINTVIGDYVRIGSHGYIHSHVSIEHSIIGNDVTIHSGARIGQDGFGFASDRHGHYKINHQGLVYIGNHVSIGANTCIDRGSLEDTIIEDECRLDNLVQIGHNVKISKGTVLAAQCGIAGSTKIGAFVVMGGQAGVIGHINIGDQVHILAKSMVIQDIPSNQRVGGMPTMKDRDWLKQVIWLKKQIKK